MVYCYIRYDSSYMVDFNFYFPLPFLVDICNVKYILNTKHTSVPAFVVGKILRRTDSICWIVPTSECHFLDESRPSLIMYFLKFLVIITWSWMAHMNPSVSGKILLTNNHALDEALFIDVWLGLLHIYHESSFFFLWYCSKLDITWKISWLVFLICFSSRSMHFGYLMFCKK